MRAIPMRSMLAATAVAVLLVGCSSSGPCQGTLLGYNCGDCILPNSACHSRTATPTQQTACEMSCGSSADQAALSNLLTCFNAIPARVGTCSLAGEATWIQSVGTNIEACALTDAGYPSTGCIEGFVNSFLDAG